MFCSYLFAGRSAVLFLNVVDVVAGVGVVFVGDFVQILYFSARHLEDRIKYGVVDSVGKPLASTVFKGIFRDEQEEIYPSCSEVAVVVSLEPIAVILFGLLAIGSGDANIKKYLSFGLDVIGIDG